MNEKGELLTLCGETDGTSTSGAVDLNCDLFYSPVKNFRIPRGMIAKVWFKKVSGEGETLFALEYSEDVTVSSPTWKRIQVEKLASKGEISIEKRRPVILHSITGKEGFRISFSQPTASKAYVELGVEFTED